MPFVAIPLALLWGFLLVYFACDAATDRRARRRMLIIGGLLCLAGLIALVGSEQPG